ncbi:hypothetical protein SAMN05444679_10370 [Variovorax sp. CF079]|nr:hypothetical protein SAMN05444679_10370 [Variovorax sp. CF079]
MPSGQKLANPCADPLVREFLARTRRAYAQRGARPKRQRALTKDPLQLLLATCDESLRGKRDRALLLFAWATGGRRRSEARAAWSHAGLAIELGAATALAAVSERCFERHEDEKIAVVLCGSGSDGIPRV